MDVCRKKEKKDKRIINREDFLKKWFEVEKKNLARKRRKRNELIILEESTEKQLALAA